MRETWRDPTATHTKPKPQHPTPDTHISSSTQYVMQRLQKPNATLQPLLWTAKFFSQ